MALTPRFADQERGEWHSTQPSPSRADTRCVPPDDNFDRPHDRLFRYAFERPEIAEGELRHLLPPEVVQAVDFTTLTIEPGSLLDTEHAELETDLLYRVQLAGRESFVFLLFEHQSSADPMMPYRMLRYMLRIWERWTRSQPEPPRRLPLIVPLLLSNDQRPWSASRSLSELYAAPTEVLVALGPHLLDVTLCIEDLPAQNSASLKARASLHRFARLVLFALQRARSSTDFVAELAPWWDEMELLARTDQGEEDLALLIRYIHHAADFEPGSLRQLVRGLGRRVEETAMTAAERLRAEGKLEGKAEGKLEGQAQLLLRLLTFRFGTLPPAAQTRVAEASLEQLAVYAERVLSASSLDDVLA
jgi:predicted transposase YdaD